VSPSTLETLLVSCSSCLCPVVQKLVNSFSFYALCFFSFHTHIINLIFSTAAACSCFSTLLWITVHNREAREVLHYPLVLVLCPGTSDRGGECLSKDNSEVGQDISFPHMNIIPLSHKGFMDGIFCPDRGTSTDSPIFPFFISITLLKNFNKWTESERFR
jgi:hypothetical protein